VEETKERGSVAMNQLPRLLVINQFLRSLVV
jgi:hypothetical protein